MPNTAKYKTTEAQKYGFNLLSTEKKTCKTMFSSEQNYIRPKSSNNRHFQITHEE